MRANADPPISLCHEAMLLFVSEALSDTFIVYLGFH